MGSPLFETSMQDSRRMTLFRILALAASGVAAVCWFVSRQAFGQDQAYHGFVDQRTLLGIPQCLNVVSNLPFLLVGVLGLRFVSKTTMPERPAWAIFFAGVAATAFGSAYYHLDPTNATLVWDRLPMTLAFMGLFSAIISERLASKVGRRLLTPLVFFGAGSVLYWHITELHGTGDLRLYYLVQFYPMLTIPLLLLLYPARYTRTIDLYVTLGLYVLAKIVEHMDAAIYGLGGIVSGHTLKHLLAALAAYWILRMLRTRELLVNQSEA